MKATKTINTINTLTPEERRELVERPFPVVTVGCQKSWRGYNRLHDDPLLITAYNHFDKFNKGTVYDEDLQITRSNHHGGETE